MLLLLLPQELLATSRVEVYREGQRFEPARCRFAARCRWWSVRPPCGLAAAPWSLIRRVDLLHDRLRFVSHIRLVHGPPPSSALTSPMTMSMKPSRWQTSRDVLCYMQVIAQASYASGGGQQVNNYQQPEPEH